VRHKLVTRIVEAYEKHGEEMKAKRELKNDDTFAKPVLNKEEAI
jgi:hypothetical protein